MDFTLNDIVQAYRKAKMDVWLRREMNEDLFFQFEEAFASNIESFQQFINRPSYQITYDEEWLGGWRLSPKKIVPRNLETDCNYAITSNPVYDLRFNRIEYANYRIMAEPTVNFQILGALWINKVGWKYDSRLQKCVYGNRLRPLTDGLPNLSARGSFQPYKNKFRKWKTDGINALKQMLRDNSAYVLTADARSFFHVLKPDFLLDDGFLLQNDIRLSPEEKELTQHLIVAINAWAGSTPLRTGLPVGLIASGVIANVALLDFDKCFMDVPSISFYGRYVDDILLVVKAEPKTLCVTDVWRKIVDASPWFSQNEKAPHEKGEKSVADGFFFVPPYIGKCTDKKIIFAGEKCRAFFVDKKTGLSFIAALESQIRDVTSEFRYLPKSVFDSKDIEDRILRLVTKEGDLADSFRKVDALIFPRRGFKNLLREMEFLLMNLPPNSWKKQRKAFYRLVEKHLLTWQKFFEYADSDFPRVITLAAQCGDFIELGYLLDGIKKIADKILSIQDSRISFIERLNVDSMVLRLRWYNHMFENFARRIRCSYNASADKSYAGKYDSFVKKYSDLFAKSTFDDSSVMREKVSRYAFHDLATTSVLQCLYQKSVRPYTATCQIDFGIHMGCVAFSEFLASLFGRDYLNQVSALSKYALAPYGVEGSRLPFGVLLPTRPLTERDILCLGDGSPLPEAQKVFFALRGYELMEPRECQCPSCAKQDVVIRTIQNDKIADPVIALLNLRTDNEMSCDEIVPPSATKLFSRFQSVVMGINSIVEKGVEIDYIVMHELAIPLRWFIAFSKHCAEYGLSMISGITYRVTDERQRLCKNEVWFSLIGGKGAFKRPFLMKEEKRVFAREEAHLLSSLVQPYKQDSRRPIDQHAVIVHGSFSFSTLICSELMDISNRSRLLGLIDALFILAWNKDIGSFGSIIEATALDLHAYVVHVNNNLFGDSRIRSPEKESWQRDILRIRGGLGCYSVVAKLDVSALRKFQQEWDPIVYYANRVNSIKKQEERCRFKPMPPSYETMMASYRKHNFMDEI